MARALLLALAIGAIGSATRQISLGGLLPVVWLAVALSFAAGLLDGRLPLDVFAAMSILAIGRCSQLWLAGESRRKLLDLPLDSRLAIAAISGFFVRGVVIVVTSLTRP